jgi:hypothetical protein
VNKKVMQMFEKAEGEYGELKRKRDVVEGDKGRIEQVGVGVGGLGWCAVGAGRCAAVSAWCHNEHRGGRQKPSGCVCLVENRRSGVLVGTARMRCAAPRLSCLCPPFPIIPPPPPKPLLPPPHLPPPHASLQTIGALDEKKREALEKTWRKVNEDFGAIFSTLLPGTTAKLEPQEGRSFLEGEATARCRGWLMGRLVGRKGGH